MKNVVFASVAAAIALAAVPASAQTVSGTVTLTGTVGEKCLVLSEGPAASTFTRSADFMALDAADGTLRPGLAADFASQVDDVRVVCTTSTPTISIDADPLAIQGAPAPAAGYDNSIDYEATVTLTLTTGATAPFSNATTDAPLVNQAVGGRLAGTGLNMSITADDFATNTATDILEAGDYEGTIQISIAPTA